MAVLWTVSWTADSCSALPGLAVPCIVPQGCKPVVLYSAFGVPCFSGLQGNAWVSASFIS